MDYQNIRIEYRDTPEKFHELADEVISYLVENLLKVKSDIRNPLRYLLITL